MWLIKLSEVLLIDAEARAVRNSHPCNEMSSKLHPTAHHTCARGLQRLTHSTRLKLSIWQFALHNLSAVQDHYYQRRQVICECIRNVYIRAKSLRRSLDFLTTVSTHRERGCSATRVHRCQNTVPISSPWPLSIGCAYGVDSRISKP